MAGLSPPNLGSVEFGFSRASTVAILKHSRRSAQATHQGLISRVMTTSDEPTTAEHSRTAAIVLAPQRG
jgi:hypothetical protein